MAARTAAPSRRKGKRLTKAERKKLFWNPPESNAGVGWWPARESRIDTKNGPLDSDLDNPEVARWLAQNARRLIR